MCGHRPCRYCRVNRIRIDLKRYLSHRLRVYRFVGLPILDGLREGVLRSSGKHNAGSLWGGSSYTGKLQARDR